MTRLFSKPARRLSDSCHIELVSILVSGRLAIPVIGVTVICVALFAFWSRPGLSAPVLAAFTIVMLVFRWRAIAGFRRECAASAIGIARALHWERRYLIIMWSYALALGAFNFQVAMTKDAVVHMLVVAEIFAFCAGQVTRTSVRPRLCAGSVFLAAVPTALGMLWPAFEAETPREAMTYVATGLLILLYSASSLGTTFYLYQTMVAQLTTKHYLAGLARLDSLTGLPNRLMMRERLEQDLRAAEPNGALCALHMIDLDGFKAVNDLHGHPAGDALLKMVADRLSSMLRAGDTAVRLGGDEFAIIQAVISSRDEAEMLGRRVLRCLSEPYLVNGAGVRIGASCGIAIAPGDARGIDLLIERADSALYRAKRAGRSTIRFWTPPSKIATARAA